MDYMGSGIIENDLKELNDFIVKNINSPHALIDETVKDLAQAGGKRIRPALTILTGRALGHRREKLIPVAASMEIIHMATLVHDDIVDDSIVRRGKPTVQSKYGKDIAVFTGDYLFSQAFSIVSNYANKENLQGFAAAVKRICEGEIEQYESRYSLDVSLLKYLRRIRRKTGVLLALSCTAGVVNKKLNPKMVRKLAAFGMYFGLAFQITDDILDYTGTEAAVGKPVGNDIRQGVYTLPLIYALKESKCSDLTHILKSRDLSDDDVNTVICIVRESGGIEYARSLAGRYIAKGIDSINFLESSRYKEALVGMINGLNERCY
jgi:Geranylgeranyl pyrophosphate synthase